MPAFAIARSADLLDEVEASLESAEVDDFLRADVLAQGAVNGVLLDERRA